MSKKKTPDQSDAVEVIDERYSLETYDGLLKATEDLLNRYLLPCANFVEANQVKTVAVLLREARGILDSQRRANAAKVLDDDKKGDFQINAAGPFSVFQGGGR